MSDQAAEAAADAEARRIEEQHPRWWVWQSDTGAWWGAVRWNLTPRQRGAGCEPHLSADNPDELAVLLAADDERAATAGARS